MYIFLVHLRKCCNRCFGCLFNWFQFNISQFYWLSQMLADFISHFSIWFYFMIFMLCYLSKGWFPALVSLIENCGAIKNSFDQFTQLMFLSLNSIKQIAHDNILCKYLAIYPRVTPLLMKLNNCKLLVRVLS